MVIIVRGEATRLTIIDSKQDHDSKTARFLKLGGLLFLVYPSGMVKTNKIKPVS